MGLTNAAVMRHSESLSKINAVKPPRQSAAFFMPACRTARRFYQSLVGVETGYTRPSRGNPDAASLMPRVRPTARMKAASLKSTEAIMAHALAFRDVTFDVRTINHTTYITSVQLAAALGYARDDAVQKIYNRNKDEFTQEMSRLHKLGTLEMSLPQIGVVNAEMSLAQIGQAGDNVRIFSLRGAHLVAMFARTPVAKEFRRWVLDVLDKETTLQLSDMRPVKWTRPNGYLGPVHKDRNMPRDDKAIKNLIWELTLWGRENLPHGEVAASFEAAMRDLHDLQVTCWTHIDEALMSMSSAMRMLNRWQARDGRIGNVG